MAAKDSSEVDLVDNVVNDLSDILLSTASLRSVCKTSLNRYGRHATLKSLVLALASFFDVLRKQTTDPQQQAVAWLLQGCQTSIALRVCEALSPEKDSLGQLLSILDETPAEKDSRRLNEFIEERFSVSERFSSGIIDGFQLPQMDEANSILQQSHDINDFNDHPDPEALAALTDTKKILLAAPLLSSIGAQLRKTLFRPPLGVLRQTLGQYILDDGQQRSIVCVIDWQLLEYLSFEGISAEDVEKIFTINGDLINTSVARFGEYMLENWKSSKNMLSVLQQLVRRLNVMDTDSGKRAFLTASCPNLELRVFPASKTSDEQALAKISGTFDTILEILEQLTWIAVTLRKHVGGQLTVSDADFRVYHSGSATSAQKICNPAVYQLSLFSEDKMFTADGTACGQCWTSIFTESVLAYGFATSGDERPKSASGLEVPLDIAAAFAGMKYPISANNRTVFATHASVLIPEQKLGSNCIQWHYEKSRSWMTGAIPRRTADWDKGLETLNISNLIHARAFIGYCRTSEVLLGTAEFEHVDASESEVPHVSKLGLQSQSESFKIILDANGKVKSANGTEWKFSRGEMAQIKGYESDSDSRLLQAANNSVLLYDQKFCVACLVSELSIVMQLANVFLRTHSQLKRQRIPLAKLSADGSAAALEAILKSKDLLVSFSSQPDRRYLDIIGEFLDVLEQRRTQTRARKLFGEEAVSEVALRGWDYADVQAQGHEIWERELRIIKPKPYPIWWELFQDSDTLVLFTRWSKLPIRNLAKDKVSRNFNCRAWDEIPTGNHFLLANIKQLQRLKTQICANPQKSALRYMLSEHLAWARPKQSRLFEQNCKAGGFCNPIQSMVRVDATAYPARSAPEGWSHADAYLQHPGPLEPTGIVLFGDEPSQFEPRRCWRHARAPMLNPSDWNYSFIVVCTMIVILAYWNFRLIATSAILFATAQYLR